MLLCERRVDAILEQTVQLRAVDLLRVGQLADRGKDFDGSSCHGLTLPVPVKRQPRFFNRGKRKAPLIAALVQYRYHFLAGITFDTAYLYFVCPPTSRIARNVGGDNRPLAAEPPPVPGVAQWPFDARRRHLEYVPFSSKIIGVEPRLDCARRRRALVDRDSLTVFPLDPNVEDRPSFTAPELELEKLQT